MRPFKTAAVLAVGVVLALGASACSDASADPSSGSSSPGSSTSAAQLLELVKPGRLVIGVEGTYPPYTYHDDSGALAGYDIEVAQNIASELGLEAEFVETKWDSLIVGLDSQLWDVVINQVAITPEREQKYAFSTPYTYTRVAVITANDNTSITKLDDLAGQRAAQTVTSNYAKTAETYGAVIVGTDGFNESIELVRTGRADVTLNDEITFADYLKQHPDAPVKIAATSDSATSQTGVILAKDKPELKDAIDLALDDLRSQGVLTDLSTKYFGKDFSSPLS
ncbi:MAG: amino acid ABC transporter substrate-binding protein [Propionibacteriaceae bacterium]|jgi:cystine transport system substrate-binding protein|nr:amino acid ABC transporter substrate-binding protein [Propionibacteriaceae bacterium]